MDTEALKPWGDDVPLSGPDAPENDGHVEHLIRYLQTVRKRFGNTAVTADLQWGASALWKRDEQKSTIAGQAATIERLTAQLIWWRTEYPAQEMMRSLAALGDERKDSDPVVETPALED